MTNNKPEDVSRKRFAAGAIDYLIIVIFFFAYVYTFGEPNATGGNTVTGLPTFTPVAFWFCWLVLPDAFFGTTFGHYLNGLRVISMQCEKPTFSQALRRRLCDAVEISWCFGLIALVLLRNTQYRQRLGDIWAKTLVVDKDYQRSTADFEFEKTLPEHR